MGHRSCIKMFILGKIDIAYRQQKKSLDPQRSRWSGAGLRKREEDMNL